ncbi:protein of unknown function [Paraburkholderia kururiensis]
MRVQRAGSRRLFRSAYTYSHLDVSMASPNRHRPFLECLDIHGRTPSTQRISAPAPETTTEL